jgi:hypothetical protein
MIETGRAPLAEVWLRWALRQRAEILVDDANFPPAVLSHFVAAAASVPRTLSDDSLVTTRWEWPPGPVSPLALGALRVSTGADSFPGLTVKVTVAGRLQLGGVALGQPRHLAPGTYAVTVSGPGLRDVSAEREVLPGVITHMAFRLLRTDPVLLYLTSDPEAVFYVDDEFVGYTSVRQPSWRELQASQRSEIVLAWGYPLRALRHQITLKAEGYVPFDTVIVAPTGRTSLKLHVKLRRASPQ